jgi:hypothetical protein
VSYVTWSSETSKLSDIVVCEGNIGLWSATGNHSGPGNAICTFAYLAVLMWQFRNADGKVTPVAVVERGRA